jgi:hypothetical protein
MWPRLGLLLLLAACTVLHATNIDWRGLRGPREAVPLKRSSAPVDLSKGPSQGHQALQVRDGICHSRGGKSPKILENKGCKLETKKIYMISWKIIKGFEGVRGV